MKRVVSIAAAVAMTAGLAACGSNDKSSGSSSGGTDQFKAAIAFDVGGRGDHSFNDASYQGLEDAKKKISNLSITTAEASESDNDQARVNRLTQLASSGNKAIVAVGFVYANAVGQVAKKFPNVKFAIIDDATPASAGSNVEQITFKENESSYLAGAAAAKTSKTGHIGFVGALKVPLIQKFEAGYIAGAKKVNPSIKVDSKYLASDGKGFNDTPGGKAAADAMFQSGADIVFAAAGKSGDGVISSAHSKGKWAIGVDSDQALTADKSVAGSVLTSATKRCAGTVEDFVNSVKDDSFKGGNKVYGLKEDGVSLSTTGNHLSADTLKTVDDLKKQVVDGKITVPTTPSN